MKMGNGIYVTSGSGGMAPKFFGVFSCSERASSAI